MWGSKNDRFSGLQQPKLFDGCKFYFTGEFIPSYKGYLHDLVVAAGGTILQRKPISRDQESLSSENPRSSVYIIYNLELQGKCDPNKKNSIFNKRRKDAEALASSTGAIVASNSWVLNSIAASNLQNRGAQCVAWLDEVKLGKLMGFWIFMNIFLCLSIVSKAW